MNRIPTTPLLRGALGADAIASGAMGVLLFALPGTLAELFHLAAALLQYVGAFLIVYSAFVGWLAMRERPPVALVWTIIIGNALWVIQSLALIASPWVAPSLLGYAFVIAQALAVGVFAELQFMGVRRALVPAASAG